MTNTPSMMTLVGIGGVVPKLGKIPPNQKAIHRTPYRETPRVPGTVILDIDCIAPNGSIVANFISASPFHPFSYALSVAGNF